MEISTHYQPPTTKISIDVNNTYHVFLSFRGADVRESLVAHLNESLCEAGLRVFLDSEELEKGRDIESSLQRAIEKSDILIPIFSKRYAESTWCLKEAERMCRSKGFIIPLFYDVEPCDVRHPQREGGAFAEAFQKHYSLLNRQDENTIQNWKNALHQISSRSGWTRDAESRYEGRLVKRVVKDVLNTLKNVPLDVPVHLVGLQRDMNDLRDRLNLGSMDSTVRVGISGIGGVGKTTLAKAVYNEICGSFDACCFLFKIGATGQDDTRLRDFQGRILRGLVNYHGEVPSVDEGRVLMRDRLRGRRILLILDDVNDRRQLHAVNGDWFGHGSRLIITSRDEHILNLAKVDSVLKMSGLEEEEALQLFSWHAFSRAFPENPYEELSTRIVKACRGNPLALEVIGAHLSDKKDPDDIQCWEEAQFNIGENPDISRVLRISYDGLSPVEKEIFLDIACYFVGERKKEAVIFWEVLYPKKVQTAIKNLSMKMLISTSGGQAEFLDMHDLVQQMGRGIQEQADNNSRLWLPMGAYKALNRDREEGVKMLSYTGENGREPVSLHSMPNLRYLFVQNTKLVGNIGELPPNLIWIKIRNCEFVSDRSLISWISGLMPRNRQQFELRILSVEQCASLTRIPKTLDKLVNLQCLSLENCSALTTLPNTLGNLLQLKQFNLCGCASLTSLPDTLGNMERLQHLSLKDCSAITTLPNTLGDLSQLKELHLWRCASLTSLPDTLGNMESLQELVISCSAITTLPNTLGDLSQLEELHLWHCASLTSLPDTLGNMESLQDLAINCSAITTLPNTLGDLSQLQELDLWHCASLTSLPDTLGNMESLQALYIVNCSAITTLPNTLGDLSQLKRFTLHGCASLTSLPDTLGNMESLQALLISCSAITTLPNTLGDLSQLEELRLCGCASLTSLPDTLGNMESLQDLAIFFSAITTLPNTLGDLSQLKELHLWGCASLTSLPDTLGNMERLQMLYIVYCSAITTLPNTLGDLSQLRKLHLCGCGSLTSLPDTLGNMESLRDLDIWNCSAITTLPNTLGDLSQLEWFTLRGCASLTSLPDTLGNMERLQHLSLEDCSAITTLPNTLGDLSQLRKLHLCGCASLTSLPDTLGNMVELDIDDCEGLKSLPAQ